MCEAIAARSGADAYFDDGYQVNRAEVMATTKPQAIRLFKVRREDLPGVDTGAGDREDLGLADDQGLLESIHLCLFPNRIIGAEFFYHGPRITRFEHYINTKLGMGPFQINELVRKNVIDQALGYKDIRLLRIKLNPSGTSKEEAAKASLDGLMDAATSYEAGVFAELTLRAEGGNNGLVNRVKALLTDLRGGDADVEIFDKLEIEGKRSPDENVSSLDILSDRIYRIVEIPHRAERFRDLNPDAAFAAIRDAYREIEDEIPDDGTAAA